jgi:hypothetical protein
MEYKFLLTVPSRNDTASRVEKASSLLSQFLGTKCELNDSRSGINFSSLLSREELRNHEALLLSAGVRVRLVAYQALSTKVACSKEGYRIEVLCSYERIIEKLSGSIADVESTKPFADLGAK